METLEEAFEKWSDKQFVCSELDILRFGAKWQQQHYGLMEIELRHTKSFLSSCEKALEERDEQQERMYSAEEVLEIIRQYALEEHLITSSKPDKWFEQFKK